MQSSIQRVSGAAAKLSVAALMVILALFGAQAHAATNLPGTALGDLVVQDEVLLGDIAFGGSSGLSYEASWSFTLSQAATVKGYFDTIFGVLDLTSVKVDSAVDTTPADFDFGVLAMGAHTLTLKGTLPKFNYDGYVGAVYASPVAEPESLALLGAGVLLAAVARRKYSATGTSSALR